VATLRALPRTRCRTISMHRRRDIAGSFRVSKRPTQRGNRSDIVKLLGTPLGSRRPISRALQISGGGVSMFNLGSYRGGSASYGFAETLGSKAKGWVTRGSNRGLSRHADAIGTITGL
jgi:hypothetical protein